MITDTGKKYSIYAVWAVFVFLIGYIKLSYHELWKDEWQAWFVASDKSLGQIFSFLYYEGHPALWYLYLKPFTFLQSLANPVSIMSIAHLVTVALGLYFLFIRFRLPLFLKIFFALSYFLFFEYGIVNRGYFMVILMTFWVTSLISQEHNNKLYAGLGLFLLCQTEVYGVFMAIALGFYIYLKSKSGLDRLKNIDFYGLALGLLVFLISVFPRVSGHVGKTRGKDLSFIDTILTSLQGNLSNTYLLGSTPDTFTVGWTAIGLVLSILCLGGLIYVFYKDKMVWKSFLAFLAMMLIFSIFFFVGGVRQWGMGFVFFVAMLELRGMDIRKECGVAGIIITFCMFGLIHNVKAVREDIRLPFTNAKKTGLFIRDKVPAKVPVVAINKFEATPVIGYAGRKFYELPAGAEFSYFRWVDKIYLPTENELKLFARYKGVGGITILTPKPLDNTRFPNVKLWQKFDEENYKKENYFLYTLPVK
ncbi:MAG: hypothetical protein IPO98_02355 [Saprospiraceae bacterium]|nr:hypothetical protein [Saprospiraceae bacterium]